jgi:hypothetical protein
MKQKVAKTDFSEQNLPHNRKEVFFDCVKLYWQKLLLLGLIMLACAVPLLTVSAVCDTVQQGLSRQLEDGVIDKVAYNGQTAWLRFAEALIDIPCYVIVCVGLSGTVRVTRQMIWAEPLFFANDFADGIKQNWLTFCLCGFLVSLLNVYLAFAESSGGGLPAYLPLGVVTIVVLPTALWMMAASSVYNIGIGKNITNSFVLYIKTPFVTWLFVALFASVAIPGLIGFVALRCILLAVFIVVLLPALVMLWQLVCYSYFDKFINKQAYPEIVDKGIWRL